MLRRKKRQGGNAFVEAALSILPLMALLFGIVDVSLLIFLKGIFQHASREGARWAITYSPTYGAAACPTQTACIKNVVRDNAMGFLTGQQQYIQVRYFAPWDLTNPITQADCPLIDPDNDPEVPDVLFANQPGNVVEVAVEGFPWNWLIPLPGLSPGVTSFALGAASSDVMQGLPVGVTTPPAP
jgi:hypothetical protein